MDLTKKCASLLDKYNSNQIISSIIKIISDRHSVEYDKYFHNVSSDEVISELSNLADYDLIKLIEKVHFFGTLSDCQKKEKGIVYTPDYIVDFMLNDIKLDLNYKYIDPSCGCAAFLIRLIMKAHKNKLDLIKFTNNSIFGIELSSETAEIAKISIQLLLISFDIPLDNITINIKSGDSLKNKWEDLFGLNNNFDYVIGNPPYVKVQNMDSDYYNFLKTNFETTKFGGFNLFYAFIEKAVRSIIKTTGEIRYIVPNNFLKIKSGKDLRDYIKSNHLLKRIVDFDCNIIFDGILTYNCILWLNFEENTSFEYQTIYKTKQMQDEINKITYNSKRLSELEQDAWILNSDEVNLKIKQIERFSNKLGPMIKTGIATLKDKVYLIDEDKNGHYYKYIDGRRYEIEKEIIRKIYRASKITDKNDISKNTLYIIFPYKLVKGKNIPFDEIELKNLYPNAYKYLQSQKATLSDRNGEKGEIKPWYAYGRSQGINNYGPKFIFSAFLDKPKFIFCNDEEALLLNGFAIYVKDEHEAKLIYDYICSDILKFYVDNTSYSIDGGFKCYQKKYLQNFSFPDSKTMEKLNLSNKNASEKKQILEDIYYK